MDGTEESENTVLQNPYFYNQSQTFLQAKYCKWGEWVDEIVDAKVSMVKVYEKGTVYKYTINIMTDYSSWDFQYGEIMNIYFYVTPDKIYRLRSYVQPQPGGEIYYFYNDDELLVKMLDTDEKLIDNGEIVCQEEEMEKEYSSITRDGDKITYCLLDIKVNGEVGMQEKFVWEKGKGLVEVGTGFGPGPYAVYLDEIKENNIAYEGEQLYQVVLEEYDRAQQDEDYTMEKWQYIFGETAGYIGRNKKLAYCFTDFNDNDWPELIIGVQEEGEETYRPYVVYVYDSENEEIAMVLENGRYLMDIYKNGVIRLRGGYYGYDFYMYYRLNEKIDSLEWLGQFTIEETDEKKCFYRNEEDNEIEITEAEFYSQRESLEDCKAELEWRELDGFWYGE
ncbi:MAG: hypothetical protein J6B68_08875 [Lachnospiraceae bacterium]|nr:hypothetical protein [Lachnospiraceae bacterium]